MLRETASFYGTLSRILAPPCTPDQGLGIGAFLDGSSAVTGSFNGTATFAAGEPNVTFLTSTGSGDIFVAHYSAALVLFLDPVVLLERLALNVFALNLQHGIENSLDAKLDTVLDALDDVNSNDDVAAVNAR